MKIIKFEPQDVLFFRDGRPFTAGENSVGDSHYPFPSVFYGALRTAIIGNNLEAFKKGTFSQLIGTPTTHGKFRSWGPFLYKENNETTQLLFPIPANLGCINDKSVLMLPTDKFGKYMVKVGNFELSLHRLWYNSYEPAEKPESNLINLEMLKEYLTGKDADCIKEKFQYYVNEERVGIKINENGTAQDRMFYRVSTYRFEENTGLATFVENDDEKLRNVKSVFLGGKRHIAFLKQEDVQIDFPIFNKKTFFLYLATPAIFKNGLLPESFDGQNVIVKGKKCKVISIANGKPLSVSTYDIASNKPRALKRAVPAGSVYFFETTEPVDFSGIVSFTDEMEEYGFGRAFIGGWDYVE